MTTNDQQNEDARMLGLVHARTMRMTDLSRTIERLHLSSPGRQLSIEQYLLAKSSAKIARDSIVSREDRKHATWLIRTAKRPVNNDGSFVV